MWDPMKNKPTLDPVIKTLCSTRFPLTAAMFALYSLCIIHIPRSRPCCWSAIYEVMQKQRLGDMSCSCSLSLSLWCCWPVQSALCYFMRQMPCPFVDGSFFSLIPITLRLFFLFFFKKMFWTSRNVNEYFPSHLVFHFIFSLKGRNDAELRINTEWASEL